MAFLALLRSEDRPRPTALALLAIGGLASLLGPSALAFHAVRSAQGTEPQALAAALFAAPLGGTCLLVFVCVSASLHAALSPR